MAAAIDHVHRRHRHHEVVHRLAAQLRDVLVERHLAGGRTGPANSHRYSQDRVRAELGLAPTPLVLGAIELLDHQLVDARLVRHIHANQLRADNIVNVCDRLEHALAHQPALVIVPQLEGLVDAGGGTTGHCRAEKLRLGTEINLDGRIAAGVEDLACADGHDLVGGRGSVERGDAWQHLALQQLQGCAAARAAMGDLVLGVVLGARGRGVAATDDRDCAGLGHLDDFFHHRLGASLELGHLEDSHGTVPNDGLGLGNGSSVLRDGQRAAIQGHETLRHTRREVSHLLLATLAELRRANEIDWQDDLYTLLLGLGHDLLNDLGTLFVVEGLADIDTVDNLEEREGHPATDDHDVDLVQHVLDELDLVADLCSTKDGGQWPGRAVQDLGEGGQLLCDQEARALNRIAIAHHGAVRTVCGPKCVAAENIRELGNGGAELGGRILISLGLVAILVDALALFLDMEPTVLQQDDRARRRVRTRRLDIGAATIAEEGHGPAELALQALGDWCERVLLHTAAVGAAEV
mmetsp:Transcript_132950/g.425532  ORF Transcript_132950/g.425532 Transcript_132950/m.425532 type:complete len:522 (+) Transcript_132950:333-1898(+)